MIARTRIAGRAQTVEVRFGNHSVARFIERARPGLCFAAAALELGRLAEVGSVQVGAPAWRAGSETFLYLVVGDLCFPLDPDPTRPDRLLARTCLVRGMRAPWRVGRAAARRRRAHHLRVLAGGRRGAA